jgi:serine/threonine protein kinase
VGFIHRDIKPANLFLTRKTTASRAGNSMVLRRPHSSALLARPDFDCPWGIIKILDFGLARLQIPDPHRQQVALTQQGAVMGTPDFLAPEQAWDSQKIDIRADLYSLGCTFYYLLSGRVPFPGGTLPEKLVRHQKEAFPPISQARREQFLGTSGGQLTAIHLPASTVPDEVAAIVHRLMAKKPSDRFQAPAELVEQLVVLQTRQPNTAAQFTIATVDDTGPYSIVAAGSKGTSQGLDPTIVVPREEPTVTHDSTHSAVGVKRPWPSLRRCLVVAGFLLCCAVASRYLTNQGSRADGQTAGTVLPSPAPTPQHLTDPPKRQGGGLHSFDDGSGKL